MKFINAASEKNNSGSWDVMYFDMNGKKVEVNVGVIISCMDGGIDAGDVKRIQSANKYSPSGGVNMTEDQVKSMVAAASEKIQSNEEIIAVIASVKRCNIEEEICAAHKTIVNLLND